MTLIIAKPTSAGRRHYSVIKTRHLNQAAPLKTLLAGTIKKTGGRNSSGKITTRHHGGGNKQKLRLIDFKRNKYDIQGVVRAIEYDPNRSAFLALVYYPDGDRRYILAPEGIVVGSTVVTSQIAEISAGNSMPLKNIPVGTPIHNIELVPGKGGQIIRSAGSSASIQSKEGKFAVVLLPSKEIRLINADCLATVGQVSNPDHKNVKLGRAGRKRHMGVRPTVRGTAQNPKTHPHGGGEGRSGVGLKYSKTPWGKIAMGKKTRKARKYSNKYIIKDRRKK
jgi:large subunit ribosomal protein L2